MADPLTDSNVISIVSLVISFLSGITTSVLAYLKQKDASELKTVKHDFESAKTDVEEAKQARQVITARLDDCEKRHDDCEQQHLDCVRKTTELAVAAATLTSKVALLEQQMTIRTRPA